MNEFLWILLVAAGSGLGFFIARSRSGKSEGAGGSPSEDWVRRSERDALQERYDQLEQRSVDKELFQQLQKKLDERQDELIKKEGLLKTAQSEQERLREKLTQQEKQLIDLEERFQKEFENHSLGVSKPQNSQPAGVERSLRENKSPDGEFNGIKML